MNQGKHTIESVQQKVHDLNEKWLEHCQRTPLMIEEGKLEFLKEIERISKYKIEKQTP